jgi:hypothetical protein
MHAKALRPRRSTFSPMRAGREIGLASLRTRARRTERPVKQNASGPAPGAFVSATSYRWPKLARIDPRAYVDAASVPHIVLPSHWRKEAVGVVLGCKAVVEDAKTGKILKAAGVLDFGPRAKLGEASIACAEFFGVPSSPKDGGTSEKRFIYTFFPGISAKIKRVTYQLQPM